MFGSKLRIDKELLKKAEKYATKKGYSSVAEFVTDVLEREIAKLEEAELEQDAMRRLQGLGYIS